MINDSTLWEIPNLMGKCLSTNLTNFWIYCNSLLSVQILPDFSRFVAWKWLIESNCAH